MSDIEHQRWLVTWKFHLYTKQLKDAERVFGKAARRAETSVRVVESGLRKARPGTWVRAQLELCGGLGDAILAVLDEADKFGDHIDVVAPRRNANGQITFCGGISRSNHTEIAAIEFKMTNIVAAAAGDRGPC